MNAMFPYVIFGLAISLVTALFARWGKRLIRVSREIAMMEVPAGRPLCPPFIYFRPSYVVYFFISYFLYALCRVIILDNLGDQGGVVNTLLVGVFMFGLSFLAILEAILQDQKKGKAPWFEDEGQVGDESRGAEVVEICPDILAIWGGWEAVQKELFQVIKRYQNSFDSDETIFYRRAVSRGWFTGEEIGHFLFTFAISLDGIFPTDWEAIVRDHPAVYHFMQGRGGAMVLVGEREGQPSPETLRSLDLRRLALAELQRNPDE